MSTSAAVSAVSGEVKGVEVKKEAAATATATEAKKEEVAVVAVVAVDEGEDEDEDDGEGEEGDCDCEECQGGIVEYEEEGGWIDELGVDEHDFY